MLAAPGDRLEVPVDRFVSDLIRADGELVEVQTGGFGPLRAKLDALLDRHHFRIVHPVAAERRIVRVDEHGEVLSIRLVSGDPSQADRGQPTRLDSPDGFAERDARTTSPRFMRRRRCLVFSRSSTPLRRNVLKSRDIWRGLISRSTSSTPTTVAPSPSLRAPLDCSACEQAACYCPQPSERHQGEHHRVPRQAPREYRW